MAGPPGCGSRPLPHRPQLSGPTDRREPRSVGWRRGRRWESGVCPGPAGRGPAAAGGVGLVASAPGVGGGSPVPGRGRGRGRRPSLPLRRGKLTLGSRLGSLTQIRHDKGRVGDLCGGTSLGGATEGEVAESADPRVCAVKPRPAGFPFTPLDALRRLRVKWVRRGVGALAILGGARPTSPCRRAAGRETSRRVLGHLSLGAAFV